MPLNDDQIQRYARHLPLAEIGVEGQEKLLRSKVLIVGVGGLGSAVSLYLAGAGVGNLGIIDSDRVELTNLQRQIAHSVQNVGRPKVESAKERIHSINSEVHVTTYEMKFDENNAKELVRQYDVLVDGTDNFSTRYLMNDTCVVESKPYIYGSIFRFEGQVSVFKSPEGPCYRCLYPEAPPSGMIPSGAVAGVIGIVPGVIGIIQATETIKYIVRKGDYLIGRLLCYNALEMCFREVKIAKDPKCTLCGTEK